MAIILHFFQNLYPYYTHHFQNVKTYFALFSEVYGAYMKERVKMLCKQKGVSMNVAELEMGIAKGYISKLSTSNPNMNTLNKIANYFGVSTEYLMTGKEPSEAKYSTEMAHLVSQIRNDAELSKALLLYFELPDNKKKHVVDTIKILSEV